MIRIGLTGSIGMGKSTVTRMFADLGAPVWSADDAVHRLYEPGGAAVEVVGAAFPGTVDEQGVDRQALARVVLGDPDAIAMLESIVHPLVAKDREAYLQACEHAGAQAVVLDIPLLFESASDEQFDAIIVVSASEKVQRERVLARPGMTIEKFEAILSQQLPDAQKRARADFVVPTGCSLEDTRAVVKSIYEKITSQH